MRIYEFVWTEDRIDHIARHSVQPAEFEEACYGRALSFRAEAKGRNPVYQFLGRSEAGRYLACFLILFPDGRGFPITARAMTARERRRFDQWRRR